ncbi:hypothetical protein GGF50DRAFT_121167 [Schizophyllum commune]
MSSKFPNAVFFAPLTAENKVCFSSPEPPEARVGSLGKELPEPPQAHAGSLGKGC